MTRLLCAILLALPLHAGSWEVSLAWVAGANALDIASSRGRMELNPILGRGPFGARQVGIKVGITGAIFFAEWWNVRKHPERRRTWERVNWIAGSAITGLAVRNWTLDSAPITPLK